MRLCSIAGCSKPHTARGWCHMHYERWRRRGSLDNPRPSREDNFWKLIDRSAGPFACWLWKGTRNNNGYGRFGRSGTPGDMAYAHRWVYEFIFGEPIPEGLEIDHLCNTRSCVNPAHLKMVTRLENVRRSAATRTKCGHPVTEGRNRCVPCANERQRERRAGTFVQSGVCQEHGPMEQKDRRGVLYCTHCRQKAGRARGVLSAGPDQNPVQTLVA